jgi:hypothetical protein
MAKAAGGLRLITYGATTKENKPRWPANAQIVAVQIAKELKQFGRQ